MTIKSFAALALASALPLAAPAMAQSSHDWSGAYLGLSYGQGDGTAKDTTTVPHLSFDLQNGNLAGIYGGYLWQQGDFVYGAELAYGKANGIEMPSIAGDEMGAVLDLKARFGYAFDKALVYGVIGYSKADYDYGGGTPSAFKLDGIALGIGASYAVTDQIDIGLEYVNRRVKGDDGRVVPNKLDIDFDTISLRIGYSF